jgi:hypothetical protein
MPKNTETRDDLEDLSEAEADQGMMKYMFFISLGGLSLNNFFSEAIIKMLLEQSGT